MSTTWKAVAGVILIFVLGCLFGGLATLGIVHHRVMTLQRDPEKLATLIERQAERGLDLDADKKTKIHTLLVENILQRFALQRQIQPQVKALNGETLQAVNALLTPEQQTRLQENLLKIKQRLGRNPLNADDGATQAKPAAVEPVPPASSGSK